MTSQTLAIVNILQSKGWQARPSNGSWLLSRDRSEGVIQMSVTPHQWLCLSTLFSGDGNESAPGGTARERSDVFRALLEQNLFMYMTKIVLNREGRPLLMTEVALKDTNPLLVDWAVESIAHYKARRQLEVVGETELAIAQSITEDNARVYTTVKVQLKSVLSKPPDVVGGVADETIQRFVGGIQNYGWRIKEKLEGFSWHLVFMGYHRYFDVFLTSSRTWLYFEIPILEGRVATVLTTLDSSTNIQEAQEQRMLFLRYLLRLNQSWFMAKIGISTDDQVLLLLEVPTQALDFALFREITRAVGMYLDRF
jgi:hypothetical protein